MHLINEKLKLIDAIKILTLQNTLLPEKTSLRFVFGIWMIFSMLLAYLYMCEFQSQIVCYNSISEYNTLLELLKANKSFGGDEFWLEELKKIQYNESITQVSKM